MHTVGYYPGMQRNEPLIHITTWMKLQIILWSGKSQFQKIVYNSIHLCKIFDMTKLWPWETDEWLLGDEGGGTILKGQQEKSLR